jgi:hypothetical protein
MAKKAIPDEVRQQVEEVVERFNHKVGPRGPYVARFQGKYLYLDREGGGALCPICRLTYTGSFDAWEFAIFKYSSSTYDRHEWFFPGSENVNGTIEGAMRAGLAAYPG